MFEQASGNVVAFNIGITVGPWLGGLAIDAGKGYASTAWIGAGLGAAALAAVVVGQIGRRPSGTARERRETSVRV